MVSTALQTGEGCSVRVFGGFLRSNRDLGVFTRATSGYVYPFLCDSFKVVVNVVLKEQF